MPLWLIPMAYVVAGIVLGFTLPRIEAAYLSDYTLGLSVASTQAFLAAAASGMMAITGIVFAIAIVMVQFSAAAYSPRVALSFVSGRRLFHAAGMFAATFLYSLATLAWVDRDGSATTPLLSMLIVLVLLVASMLIFALLMQRSSSLQITNVLEMIGDEGRKVIRALLARREESAESGPELHLGPVTQVFRYAGKPRVIASFDLDELVRLAERAGGIVEVLCAVGDTLVAETPLLQIRGRGADMSEQAIMRAVRIEPGRTFDQDPKFAIRLLVDIATKALSPAINDPTTALQAIDQIEDLLGRLGRSQMEPGQVRDATGRLRVIVPVAAWEDYLALGFDEMRQYGASSTQVVRRLRAALTGLEGSITDRERQEAVRRHLARLDTSLERSIVDVQDLATARMEDRQGLGVTRKRPAAGHVVTTGAPAA
jgi:uncharacterized membrane protein